MAGWSDRRSPALRPSGRPHSLRRQLDGFVDLDVTGAAAEVAGERLLDGVARRRGISGQQRLGREQERRRAVAALRRAHLGERVLKWMQPSTLAHALDRTHVFPRAGDAEDETRQYRQPVDQHRAGPAFAQLAAMLGAGETEV